MRVIITRDLSDYIWIQALLAENLPISERDEQIIALVQEDGPAVFDGAIWEIKE